jgi:hypothetical protein
MAIEVQRVRYFTGEFLQEADFNAEQAYHMRMRYLHNRWLHISGIVHGLDVRVGPGPLDVTVEEGMALVRMVEPSITEFRGEDVAKELVLTDERVVTLSPGDVTGDSQYYIVASFEQKAEQKQGDEATRWVERPAIHAKEAASGPLPDNETTLILARVQVNSGATAIASVDSSERRVAGVRGDVEATRVRLPVSGVLDPTLWPTLRGGAERRLDLAGSLNIVDGNLGVAGSLNVTRGNVTLPDSATVDGRDVSVDGSRLDDHLSDSANAMALHVTRGDRHNHMGGAGSPIPWAALTDVPDLQIKAFTSVNCSQTDLTILRRSNVLDVVRPTDGSGVGEFTVKYGAEIVDPMVFVTVQGYEPLFGLVTKSDKHFSTISVVRPTGSLVDPTLLHVLVV